MPSKHFCCCIPVRFGVWVMSITTFLGWGAAAGLTFDALAYVTSHPQNFAQHLSTGQKIGWIATGIVFTIFTLISLFGFIGACLRNRNYVNNYKGLILFMWIIDLIVSIGLIALIFMIKGNKTLSAQCSKGIVVNGQTLNTTPDEIQQCQNAIKALQDTPFVVTFICVIVFGLLWNLYGVIIVRRYVDQLDDDESYIPPKGYNNPSSSTVNVNLGSGYNPAGYGRR